MKLLGTGAAFSTFRTDLTFLRVSVATDELEGVQALAPEVVGMIKEVNDAVTFIEEKKVALTEATAIRRRRMRTLGRELVRLGGVARATDPAFYSRCFSTRAPSGVNRLGAERALGFVVKILGELNQLPAIHPLRVAYEGSLTAARDALALAVAASATTANKLALAQTQIRELKGKLDKGRASLFGRLIALLGSRSLADEYFPSYSNLTEAEGEDA